MSMCDGVTLTHHVHSVLWVIASAAGHARAGARLSAAMQDSMLPCGLAIHHTVVAAMVPCGLALRHMIVAAFWRQASPSRRHCSL